jgi:hypothetical protein
VGVTLPAGSDPSLSSAAPSWARVVRDGVNATSLPLQFSPREDFFHLYELCVANGFTARVAIRSASGSQEISLSCRLRAPPSNIPAQTAQRRRRRRRRPRNTAVGDATNHVVHAPLVPESSPTEPSGPELSPTPRNLITPSPPPAKRTRRAVKRRCEAELLRIEEGENTLLLSPLHASPTPQLLSPLSTTTTSPTPRTPPPLSPLKQDQSTQVLTTPEPPSPTAAPTDLFTPPPVALASPSAPEAADECAEPVLCTLTADGPPPPPPWPESYVFSDDPDRIVCRKCCNRHYNFRWYNHCFMCHNRK